MYSNAKELVALCKVNNDKISTIAIKEEAKSTQKSIQEVKEKFLNHIKIMKEASIKTLTEEIPSVSGLTSGNAKKVYEYMQRGRFVSGRKMLKSVAYAFSAFEVNASMGKIVAAPTAGACGIMPGSIFTVEEEIKASQDEVINAFATGSAIGYIIQTNATLSGAEGGCQAECGSASSMAAAGIVEMMGGTVGQCLHAAAMSITNVMGQVCDPIAGLVEIPCGKRNAIGVYNALLCADLALAGVECIVPFDEVVDAMYEVGKSIPCALRETGLGGLAGTPTGIAIRKKIFGE